VSHPAENTEVTLLLIQAWPRRAGTYPAPGCPGHRRRRATARSPREDENRHAQVAQQNAAVGVRIGAHPAVALGRQFGQFRLEPAIFIEQFLRLVTLHPAFKQLNMVGMLGIHQQRYLMRPETCPRLAGRRRLWALSSPWATSGRSWASAAAPHRCRSVLCFGFCGCSRWLLPKRRP